MKLNTWGCIFDSGEPPMWTVKPMNNQEIIDALTAERDALAQQVADLAWEATGERMRAEKLAAENKRLREALGQWEWRDTLFDDGETHITYCPACGKLQRDGHEADCWMKAALSLQPPTASPSAPEGVSGDSEFERLRRVEKAYNAEWRSPGPTCQCDEAYSGRGLEDPDCMYHRSPLVWDALAALAKETSDANA